MRKHYTPTLKAKVVLELLKDEKPITRIASEQGIHPTQLRGWKKQGGPITRFSRIYCGI
jgi:transposase-like protein